MNIILTKNRLFWYILSWFDLAVTLWWPWGNTPMKTNPVTMSPYTVLTLAVESVGGRAGHNGPNMASCLLFSPILQHQTGVTYLTKGNLVGFHPSNPYVSPPPTTSWELLGVFLFCGLGWFSTMGCRHLKWTEFWPKYQKYKKLMHFELIWPWCDLEMTLLWPWGNNLMKTNPVPMSSCVVS